MPMKSLMAAALILGLSTIALAKPNPVEFVHVNTEIKMGSVAAIQENIGSVGAMRERAYFEAPQSPLNDFPCRLQPDLFAKMRLAQYCR
jgi:hypothetical protein